MIKEKFLQVGVLVDFIFNLVVSAHVRLAEVGGGGSVDHVCDLLAEHFKIT